jgi:choline dehydrogenase-like flavoprotein
VTTGDVPVIGAGVAGCAVADELAAAGARVVVAERRHLEGRRGRALLGRDPGLRVRDETPACPASDLR